MSVIRKKNVSAIDRICAAIAAQAEQDRLRQEEIAAGVPDAIQIMRDRKNKHWQPIADDHKARAAEILICIRRQRLVAADEGHKLSPAGTAKALARVAWFRGRAQAQEEPIEEARKRMKQERDQSHANRIGEPFVGYNPNNEGPFPHGVL